MPNQTKNSFQGLEQKLTSMIKRRATSYFRTTSQISTMATTSKGITLASPRLHSNPSYLISHNVYVAICPQLCSSSTLTIKKTNSKGSRLCCSRRVAILSRWTTHKFHNIPTKMMQFSRHNVVTQNQNFLSFKQSSCRSRKRLLV